MGNKVDLEDKRQVSTRRGQKVSYATALSFLVFIVPVFIINGCSIVCSLLHSIISKCLKPVLGRMSMLRKLSHL